MPSPNVVLVTNEAELRTALDRILPGAYRVVVDLESNGMHAYRPRVCVVQLAVGDEIVVVDSLTVPAHLLAALLGSDVVAKIVHDVAFDARLFADEGAVLKNVQDTSIAARFLGRAATGLASLLKSELGIDLDKKMQHHDWQQRPLDVKAVEYLSGDVAHLAALADKLFADVDAKGILPEVMEETKYRLLQAAAAKNTIDPRPPWVRLKGADKAPAEDLSILRAIAELRETKARDLDVPPYKILAPDVLFAIARAKPGTRSELDRIRGATQGGRARSLVADILKAVASPPPVPEDEKKLLERPRLASSLAKQRRAREQKLSKWRKHEAFVRQVDEQAILPGHCLQSIADLDDATLASMADVPGIGAFRVDRDGRSILLALAAPEGVEAP